MFLESPHLRFEGLYVSRNTYIRQGVAEWKRERTCHLVTYFRYFRFFQDGTLLYRTSPHTVKTVAKSLVRNPCQHGTRPANKYEQHVHTGRYVIKGGKVYLIIVYPNSHNTEVRARCNIRGVPQLGACNRLDLEELVSFDRDTGSSSSMLGSSDPDQVPTGAGDVTNFRRGLAPCVFVPWECVATSVLNLPVKDMDYWMPG
jgi:F-box protein 9